MKKFWTAVATVLLMGGAVSFLFTVEATVQDNYWADIAQGNMAEIEAGNMALQRSQNEQVRQFAQQMVTDHTAAGTDFQTLATSKNITLPTAVTAKQQSEMTKLGAMTGADFDRAFMKMMVKDHERMAKLLSREANRNADADVKAFAAKTLPVVQGHLTMARSLNDSLKGSGSAKSSNGMSSNSNRSDSSTMKANSNRSNSNRTNSNKSNSNSNSNSNNSNANRM